MSAKATISTIVLGATTLVAAAGWLGVRLEGPNVLVLSDAPGPGSSIEVRRRDAWQPSPVPSTVGVQPASVRPANSALEGAEVRRRDAWQPSPVPTPQVKQERAINQTALAPQITVPATADTPRAVGLWGLFSRLTSSVQDPAKDLRRIAEFVASVDGTATDEPLAGVAYHAYDDMFTTERLEALYGPGILPSTKGEWHYETVPSKALGVPQQLLVWTPTYYESTVRRYPTLYLLHGAGGPGGFGVDEWLGYAITEDLDRLIDSALIEPMIVVLPDGRQDYWVNHANGGPQWASYITDDVVSYVDANFRTDARRERRAIGGLSMGGHGALQIAYRRPDLFAIAGAHSPTVRQFEDSPPFFGDAAYFAKYDPLTLARTASGALQVTTWIDLGNEDKFRATTVQLRDALAARSAPMHFHVFEGEHEGWYWMGYLPEYLRFYSTALEATTFTQSGAPDVPDDTVLLAATAQSLR